MAAKYLWEVGSLIFAFLGGLHLYYTFFTDKFSSKNDQVIEGMKMQHPKLTNETSLWKAWIGFNGSHSAGALFIGIINFYLAYKYFEIIKNDALFFVINLFTIGFYIWLAKTYWFKIPLIGVSITFICFALAYLLCI